MEGKWKQWQILFSWAPKSLQTVTAGMKLKDACFLEEQLTNLESVLKSRDITLLTKGSYSQRYGFSSNHVWMWELEHKEIWVLKNWCFWSVVLQKTLVSPLDTKEIKPVQPKGNQSWIFIGRTDAEAETPILWPPDVNWLSGKDPDAGKDRRQEEKGTPEDEMVGRHHQLDGHEFQQAPGVGDGQASLVCCSPWGHKESDTTEWLNWTDWTNKRRWYLRCRRLWGQTDHGSSPTSANSKRCDFRKLLKFLLPPL